MEVCGVPESAVDDVILQAVTWRVTAAGRPLIDRRRRSKVERNMPIVAAYLTDVCGVLPGKAFSDWAVSHCCWTRSLLPPCELSW